ncbi:MAG TPA: 3-hydroxyacyl-CoA dehydrogenase NAD-binding domain-containing protein, partial [Hyphomicrobiaceae bacterium]|nr:3-hydroxyacyl-CoA dehydrogenase NAD-binding domain-containing protein [Hyphomicrobiaceae bacterium]
MFARSGFDVRLWDPHEATLREARDLIAASLDELARHGLVADPAGAAKRITTCTSMSEAVAGAEIVQENGPERLDAKLAIFAELDRLAPATAILASSSSAIVASKFTEGLAGRSRCLIAHP